MRFLKSILFLVAAFGLSAKARAGEVFERPWSRHGTPYAVALTTYSYTMVPPTAIGRLQSRTDILVANPHSNSSIMWGHLGTCTSTAVSTSTVKGPFKFYPTGTEKNIPISETECLW